MQRTPAVAQKSIHQTQYTKQASLSVVLALTWLGSFGTGIGWSGVFFISKQAFGFSETMNLFLASAVGLGYTVSSLFAGRVVGILTAKLFKGSVRSALFAVVLGLAICSISLSVIPTQPMLIAFCALYNGLCGFLWPTVEAYLSGGRSPKDLRSATGRFNIAWASAVVVSLLAMTALTTSPDEARWVFAGLGILHLVMLAFVAKLPRAPHSVPVDAVNPIAYEPSPNEPDADRNPVERNTAKRLLILFRAELVISYFLVSGIGPVLPHILAGVGIHEQWRAAVGSTWMATRLAVFFLFERWHGWHGKTRTIVWSSAALLIGVAGAASAANAALVIISLAILGFGMGAAYAGALYYAMHSGGDHVTEGGRHEAMIGLGYTIGPIAALIAGTAFDVL